MNLEFTWTCWDRHTNGTVGARGHKLTGAVCLRLPRAEFLALLEHFPDDEEIIAQAAMMSLDIQKARRSEGSALLYAENKNYIRTRLLIRLHVFWVYSVKSGSIAQKSDKSGSRSSRKSKSSNSKDIDNYADESSVFSAGNLDESDSEVDFIVNIMGEFFFSEVIWFCRAKTEVIKG